MIFFASSCFPISFSLQDLSFASAQIKMENLKISISIFKISRIWNIWISNFERNIALFCPNIDNGVNYRIPMSLLYFCGLKNWNITENTLF